MSNVLEITGLCKHFGSKQVLSGVTLSVPENCVFGFVGRNGAGKTTTMKSVIGLLKPDGGEITVCGERVTYGGAKTNRFIGYLPDVPEFYGYMTAREYLALCGKVAGMKSSEIKERTDELLRLVGLSEEKHRIKGYSRGMKQRLGIAQAMINDPAILVLDEPTSGLDPKERVRFRNLIAGFAQDKIVILSTHIVSDVEFIAGRILVMNNGAFVMDGAPDQVVSQAAGKVWECHVEAGEAEHMSTLMTVANVRYSTDGRAVVRVVADDAPTVDAYNVEPTLEDLYLHVFSDADAR